jgi:hypothetical protein
MGSFSRAENYIAFPNVKIATNDRIMLPAKMGIDATTIKRGEGKGGYFYLESSPINNKVYDASLRITGTGESTDVVGLGAVWVERDVTAYREMQDSEAARNAWMPFASPFAAAGGGLRSGYFAGNFVRKTQAESGSGHVQYVYANPPSATDPTTIDKSAYIIDAATSLDPAVAYVISLRHPGFNYQGLTNGDISEGGLWWTNHTDGGDANKYYDRNVFVFGDRLYAQGAKPKQLYADQTLFTSVGKTPRTDGVTNWVIGNSYTAGIDVNKLAEKMKESKLNFGDRIFIFYGEANQSYVPVNLIDTDFNIIPDLDVIPTQLTFVLQVHEGSPADNTFAITKDMLKHGDKEHGAQAAKGNHFSDEVLFTVSPVDNPKQRDVTLMGFRSNAKGTYDKVDLEKIYNTTNNAFQLYSTSDDDQRLVGNALSFGTARALLCFKPSSEKANFVISTSRLESLNTEIVVLEDLKTRQLTDLRVKGEYEFTALPDDNANRFIVHFTNESLGKREITNNDFDVFYDTPNGKVVVIKLLEQDKGSLLVIANAQGKIVANGTVSASDVEAARMELPVSLVDGVYIASLKGNRNLSKKFVVKPHLQ